MESREQNYGITGEPEAAGQEPVGPRVVEEEQAGQDRAGYSSIEDEAAGHGAVVMGAREERTWSVLSHLSGFLNIFTLFLGPVAALVVWLVYRGAWLAILGVGWALTIALTFVLVGFLLIPAMMILTVVPFAHMGYAAYKVGKEGEYRYPIVADLIGNR
jgi:hypothetical protein